MPIEETQDLSTYPLSVSDIAAWVHQLPKNAYVGECGDGDTCLIVEYIYQTTGRKASFFPSRHYDFRWVLTLHADDTHPEVERYVVDRVIGVLADLFDELAENPYSEEVDAAHVTAGDVIRHIPELAKGA